MKYYLKVLKEYAVFKGRARRTEFWMFVLFNIIFSIVATILDKFIGIKIISSLYGLAVLIPSLAVGVRRLHDIAKSGWWWLIGLIPLVGQIWLIVLFASNGNSGENKYGPDPKVVA
jgi:uncharacterized membrane protein YhaH (DUF805 family)